MYILIVIIEIIFLVGAIFVFINPILCFVITFFAIAIIIHILSLLIIKKDKNQNLIMCMKFVSLYHSTIIIPAMLFVLARCIGFYLKNAELFCFLVTSLIFIIPIVLKEIFTCLSDNSIFICPAERNIIIEEGKVVLINDDPHIKNKKQDRVSLFALVFSILKIVLLLLITITDYINIEVIFAKDIYAGIIFTVAFDAFFSPIATKYRKRKRVAKLEKYKLELDDCLEKQKRIIKKCHEQAQEDKLVVNKFLDLLSIYL